MLDTPIYEYRIIYMGNGLDGKMTLHYTDEEFPKLKQLKNNAYLWETSEV